MHKTGKNFALMSATYSATEMSMDTIRKKNDILNSAVAGAAAGVVGSKKRLILGYVVFVVYSGSSIYFEKFNNKTS